MRWAVEGLIWQKDLNEELEGEGTYGLGLA